MVGRLECPSPTPGWYVGLLGEGPGVVVLAVVPEQLVVPGDVLDGLQEQGCQLAGAHTDVSPHGPLARWLALVGGGPSLPSNGESGGAGGQDGAVGLVPAGSATLEGRILPRYSPAASLLACRSATRTGAADRGGEDQMATSGSSLEEERSDKAMMRSSSMESEVESSPKMLNCFILEVLCSAWQLAA